jgi:polyhydroxyalkanoate synthesis regulator phasin
MTEEGQKRGDPGDTLREGVRAISGIIGAFKDAIEETFKDLSDRGDIAPDRARDAARDAMRRAQEAVEEMRTRVDFVTRREFDSLKSDVDELRAMVERHMTHGSHHAQGAGGAGPAGSGGAGSGTGAGGSGMGDGSPGL